MTRLRFYSTETLDQSALNRQINQQRIEVSGLVMNGMQPTDAAELVGADLTALGELTETDQHVPTPEMIRAECERFRTNWPSHRLRSQTDAESHWTPPACSLGDISAAIAEAG